MRYLFVILTILTFNYVLGQNSNSDSLTFNMYLDKYVNRNFDSIINEKGMQNLEMKYGLTFKSLASCINPMTSKILEDNEIKIIYVRLEQLAENFFRKGTPILISVGGLNSVENTEKFNKKGNKYNVTSVSFGNGCVVEQNEKDF